MNKKDITNINTNVVNEIGQKNLSSGLLIAFLTCLSAFPALSTDLYLPALPGMAKLFGASESLTNMTLTAFFISFGVLSLVWGPISDKIGRKPVLLIGGILFMLASILCSFSPNVYILIIARILQAAGGAACTAMGTAIVKDAYRSKKREFAITMVQAMTVICPTIAPFLGALLLPHINWNGIFIVQAGFGVLVLIGAILYSESIPDKLTISLFSSLGRLKVVMQNKNFVIIMLSFTIINASGMAFIGVSSYIYVDYYGMTPQQYSLFFAFNAICMMGGNFIYIWLAKFIQRSTIIIASLVVSILSGIAVIFLTPFGPFAFAIALVPSFIASSCMKPPGMLLMLNQQKKDTGSASSIIMSAFMIMGTLGIMGASLSLFNFAILVGIITIICSVISIMLYLWFLKRNPSAQNFY